MLYDLNDHYLLSEVTFSNKTSQTSMKRLIIFFITCLISEALLAQDSTTTEVDVDSVIRKMDLECRFTLDTTINSISFIDHLVKELDKRIQRKVYTEKINVYSGCERGILHCYKNPSSGFTDKIMITSNGKRQTTDDTLSLYLIHGQAIYMYRVSKRNEKITDKKIVYFSEGEVLKEEIITELIEGRAKKSADIYQIEIQYFLRECGCATKKIRS